MAGPLKGLYFLAPMNKRNAVCARCWRPRRRRSGSGNECSAVCRDAVARCHEYQTRRQRRRGTSGRRYWLRGGRRVRKKREKLGLQKSDHDKGYRDALEDHTSSRGKRTKSVADIKLDSSFFDDGTLAWPSEKRSQCPRGSDERGDVVAHDDGAAHGEPWGAGVWFARAALLVVAFFALFACAPKVERFVPSAHHLLALFAGGVLVILGAVARRSMARWCRSRRKAKPPPRKPAGPVRRRRARRLRASRPAPRDTWYTWCARRWPQLCIIALAPMCKKTSGALLMFYFFGCIFPGITSLLWTRCPTRDFASAISCAQKKRLIMGPRRPRLMYFLLGSLVTGGLKEPCVAPVFACETGSYPAAVPSLRGTRLNSTKPTGKNDCVVDALRSAAQAAGRVDLLAGLDDPVALKQGVGVDVGDALPCDGAVFAKSRF